MTRASGLGLLVIALVLAASSREGKAFRPFDGTDAAVAVHGKVEVELGPAEYLREGRSHAVRAFEPGSTTASYRSGTAIIR